MLIQYECWQCSSGAELCEYSSVLKSSTTSGRVDAHLDNLIASDQLVNVFPRPSVEQQAGQVERTFPGLETAFVNTGADIRFVQLIDDFIVGVAFLEELYSDIVKLSFGQEANATCRRLYPDGTI